MVTPNEQKKEDAEVYPVIVLDPNGNEYTKGIAAWLTAIAKQDPKKPCVHRSQHRPRKTRAVRVHPYAMGHQRR